jgi:hypothetical protein
MAKKPSSLSAALMPVDEEAAIPPRVQTEGDTIRQPEAPKASKPELPHSGKPEKQNASETAVGLNFKVQPSFRKEFRLFCAEYDLSLVEALAQAFELLKRSKNGKSME